VKWWAHELCSLLAVLALLRDPLQAPLVVAGAVFPDVVEWAVGARHRSMHELAFYIALAALSAPVGLLAFSLAALDHVLTDALTVRGVTAFGWRLRGPLSTESTVHNLLAVALHYAVAALLAP
jgi:hypothetical protein